MNVRILTICMVLIFNLLLQRTETFGAVQQDPSFKDSTILQKDIKPEPPVYTTIRLSTIEPVIDGKLDDDCWKTGDWAGDFIQWIPSEGGKPTFPTEFKILYDDKNIYVALRAFDPEINKIQRYAGIRDELMGDMMGINFDSYHDHRTGFEFNMTAYGQKVDMILSNPMTADLTWNPVWTGTVGFEDSAWIAEMEIPLNQIRYSSEEEQVWGLHIWRWIGRLSEESDWEYQTLTGPGMLYNFGELRGIKGLEKSQRLEIMPYALGSLKTLEKEPGNPFAENGRIWGGNAGLDVKLGISSNFTLDMTINPDFGQVESDPSVMNLTAFETFYEEKRPFFLEAKNIFKYDFDEINLFYSRRIGHSPSYTMPETDSTYTQSPTSSTILSAFKLSGKTAKGLSVGALQSLTGPEHAQISDLEGNKSKETIEPLTNYMVARIQKDYHEGTTMIGGILTSANRFINDSHLDFISRDAYSGGLDLLHQWKNKKYYIDTRLVGSYVKGDQLAITRIQESSARYYQRPGANYLDYDTTRNQIGGFGGRAKIGKGTGQWRYSTGLSWYSPGLELNDIGYMQETDIIHLENEISYFVNQPVSIFRMYSVNLEQFNRWNFGGKFLGSGGHLAFNSEFKNKWGANVNLIFVSEALDTRILRGGYDMKVPFTIMTFGMVRTDGSRRIWGELSYEYLHCGSNSQNSYSLGPKLFIRPVNTLKVGVSANFGDNMNQLQYVNTLQSAPDNKYILGAIDQQTLDFTFRVDYSITPKFSLQYYGSPFISKGIYADYKEVTNPLSSEYSQRYIPYTDPLESPDFNFQQFRSNFVAKWEYRPGSFIYIVWSDDRTGNADPVSSSLLNSMKQLWKLTPENFFLIKINYWFSI